MTLLQLKYVVTVAAAGTISEAAKQLYMTQPSLIEDAAKLRSEVGVLYLNSFNETVLRSTLRENNLEFRRLFIAKPHVFVSTFNPLAKKNMAALEDLAPYPRLSYEQGEHNSFYFSEEILSTLESKKDIMVSDRATLFNLLIGLNGYTICSGVINEDLNRKNIVAVPLAVDDYMEIGYITHIKVGPGKFNAVYRSAEAYYLRQKGGARPHYPQTPPAGG